MNIIQNYIEKHKEIMEDASSIGALLNDTKKVENSEEIRTLLSVLAGKLKVHLAAEDKFLYPLLMNDDDIKVRATAQSFVDEMGGIYNSFSDFLARWPSASAIRENSSGFSVEMKEILTSLAERIKREDSELYPLTVKQPRD